MQNKRIVCTGQASTNSRDREPRRRGRAGAIGELGLADKVAGSKSAPVDAGFAATTGTEPIDRAYLARFTLGDAALEREVLELFATQTPLYIQQLQAAVTHQARKDVAHAIKGSALAIGAWHLASLAQLAGQLDVEDHRERTISALAASADEACRHIACLFATA